MDAGQLVIAAAPLAVLSVLLALIAARDLVTRPARTVVGGRKLPWGAVLLLTPVGPLAYIWLGRRNAPRRRES